MILHDSSSPRIPQESRSRQHHGARGYAKREIPVFPCAPGGKAPMTERGFYDATTDEEQIDRWWTEIPSANPAIPTGPATGLLVIDVDKDRYGFGSLDELEERYGPLPVTATVITGRGGQHLHFRYPEGEHIKSRADAFGLQGVDVKAVGGYVLVPPSRTEGPYERQERRPIAELPPAWLEALREAQEPHRGISETIARSSPTTDLDGIEAILVGQRNQTLTRFAGRLHDGRSFSDLVESLLAINAERCVIPLPETEVLTIANSIFRREPCSPSKKATGAVIGVLGEMLRDWWQTPWPGLGGKTRRDVELACILEATHYGEITPAGDVALSISRRQTAERARASVGATQNAFVKLREAGRVRGGANGPTRKDGHAAGVVLIAPRNRRKVEHSLPSSVDTNHDGGGVQPCAIPASRRGRHSAPGLKREATKSAIAVVDHLEHAGSWLSERDLADRLGVKRPWDVRRRYLEPLAEADVVECSHTSGGRLWRLADGWQGAVDAMFACGEALERDTYGGKSSDEYQRVKHAEASRAYRNRHRNRPDRSPSQVEMDAARERREETADSEICELEHVEEERGPDHDRRQVIQTAMSKLFTERPEYKARRVGQVTCALVMFNYLSSGDAPRDAEVQEILSGEVAA